jgi:hypothetical protein
MASRCILVILTVNGSLKQKNDSLLVPKLLLGNAISYRRSCFGNLEVPYVIG